MFCQIAPFKETSSFLLNLSYDAMATSPLISVCVCVSEHHDDPDQHRPRVPGAGDPVGAAADGHAEQEEGGGGEGAAATHRGGDGEGEEEEGGGGATPPPGGGGQEAVSLTPSL